MKRTNWLLIAAVLLLTALPLWLVPRPAAGPDGQPGEIFAGADSQAQKAIEEIAPGYQPWFAPLLEPASGEIASLLFALQAAIGRHHRLLAGGGGHPREDAAGRPARMQRPC